jgi:phosphatidate cytidylyltransferase
MSVTQKYQYLFIGLIICLVVASTIGVMLKRKLSAGSSSAFVDNLISRTNAWWVMIIALALVIAAGSISTIILFAIISFFGLREFVTLTPTKPGDHYALSLSFFILVPLQYFLIYDGWYSLFAILIPVYGFLFLPMMSVLSGDTESFLERVAKIQWGLMICVYCISYSVALLMLDIPEFENQSPLLLLYLLLVAQMSDVLQYTFGKLFGKTKVAPLVSPNKTLEGLVYGGATATIVGGAMWWITPFSPLQSAALAFVIVLMGFMGGLVMSAVKRSIGKKDWGTMIQGHGGILDRMDSICFSAPIFFHIVRYYYT